MYRAEHGYQDQCAYYQEAAERRERKQYPEAADVGFAGRLELRVAQSGERQCADRREDEQTGIQPDDRSETERASNHSSARAAGDKCRRSGAAYPSVLKPPVVATP
jgi:hypothetical protein